MSRLVGGWWLLMVKWAEEEDRKGLRFEVKPAIATGNGEYLAWGWELVGAEGVIAISPVRFESEKDARSHISKNRGRFTAAKRAKVLSVEQMMATTINTYR